MPRELTFSEKIRLGVKQLEIRTYLFGVTIYGAITGITWYMTTPLYGAITLIIGMFTVFMVIEFKMHHQEQQDKHDESTVTLKSSLISFSKIASTSSAGGIVLVIGSLWIGTQTTPTIFWTLILLPTAGFLTATLYTTYKTPITTNMYPNTTLHKHKTNNSTKHVK